jgi:hypothetical protein
MRYKKSSDSVWLYFPLSPVSGPLTADYTPEITITGLDADTNYDYYAYMIVGGVEYVGATLTVKTLALSATPPTVITGIAGSPTYTTLNITGNQISSKGVPAIINQYGVLYATNSYWGDVSRLKWENAPTNVKIRSTSGDVIIPHTFVCTLTGLTENTTTYYRAFARNNSGEGSVGYGTIKTEQTIAQPRISMLYIYGADNNGGADASNGGELTHIPDNGTFYNATICWCMYKGQANVPHGPSIFCVEVCCNGSVIRDVQCSEVGTSQFWSTPACGSFAPFNVNWNDNIRVCVYADTYGTTLGSCTKAWLASVHPNNGSYLVGSQNSTVAYTCGSFPTPPPAPEV